MLTTSAPTPIIGELLEADLATAGLPTTVTLNGTLLEFADLDESDRPAAQSVVDGHAVKAQAALDAAATGRANEATIQQRATTALTANTTFLAVTSPTNAQIAAQVKALTRQNNGLIRLVLRRFDGTD